MSKKTFKVVYYQTVTYRKTYVVKAKNEEAAEGLAYHMDPDYPLWDGWQVVSQDKYAYEVEQVDA